MPEVSHGWCIVHIHDVALSWLRAYVVAERIAMYTDIRADQLAFERQCSGKKGYPDEKIANKVIGRVKWDRGVILRKYVCPFCACWHLTKLEKT
jgi:hypothetical protein